MLLQLGVLEAVAAEEDVGAPGVSAGMVTIKFKVSWQVLTNNLNQVSSVSLLMTSSTALANEGLFELTWHPLLTRAVLLSFAETTEEPACSQAKKLKLDKI